MRSLYVVIHPEATHHVDRLIGGWYDSELTLRGRKDAELIANDIARRVGRAGDVAVFTSDLRRTTQTAEPIAQRLAASTKVDEGLRERSYGAAEGTAPGSTPIVVPPVDGDRLRHWDGIVGSETTGVFAARLYAALDRILGAGARDSVIVTHGGCATYLIAAWIRMPLDAVGYVKFATPAGSISVLCEDDQLHERRVIALGGTEHLGK